jgi:hypothetical protein
MTSLEVKGKMILTPETAEGLTAESAEKEHFLIKFDGFYSSIPALYFHHYSTPGKTKKY